MKIKRKTNSPKEEKHFKFEDQINKKDILDDNDDDDDVISLDSDGEISEFKSHKKTLESLKDKDPEFYEYLKTHDKKLLEFDDELDDDIQEEKEVQEDEIKEKSESLKITIDNVKKWRRLLQNPSGHANCLMAIKSIIKAFRQAVHQTNDDENCEQRMRIMNPTLFNMIINTSLIDLVPALIHYLKLKNVNQKDNEPNEDDQKDIDHEALKNDHRLFFDPRRSRNWKRVMPSLKMYLTDVIKIMYSLSIDARISFERHTLELMPFYQTFPHLLKRIIRRSIQEWYSCDEERSRVLAFLILYRSIRTIQYNDHWNKSERQTLINHILRQLYLAYAVATKTTNEMTLPKIKFMRNSLVELYNLEHSIAYQQAFIFMRQLTINLRKSVMNKEKDSLKRVYNWQFVHSINLWSQLIGSALKRQNDEMFLHLLTPITNISFEALRVFSAFKYLPFRMHILDAMIKLSAETGYFIPVLKIISEFLDQIIKNKNEIIAKNKTKLKMEKNSSKNSDPKSQKKTKKMILDVMLKLNNKDQTLQMEYIEKVVDKIYEQLLYYLKSCSHFVSFPEMILVFYNENRKKVKSVPYQKGQAMMKQLFDKCDENAQYIIKQRYERNINMKIKDLDNQKLLNSFESELKNDPNFKTPLVKFYEHWKQFKLKQQQKNTMNDNDEYGSLKKLAYQELLSSNSHEFNVEQDLEKMEFEENDDEEDEEICLTEEQLKKLQQQQGELDEDEDDEKKEDETEMKKRNKRKRKRKNKKNKKTRSLNPNLKLEGAFQISSDDEYDES